MGQGDGWDSTVLTLRALGSAIVADIFRVWILHGTARRAGSAIVQVFRTLHWCPAIIT